MPLNSIEWPHSLGNDGNVSFAFENPSFKLLASTSSTPVLVSGCARHELGQPCLQNRVSQGKCSPAAVVAPPSARAQPLRTSALQVRVGVQAGVRLRPPTAGSLPRCAARVTVSYVLLGPAWSLTSVATVACG